MHFAAPLFRHASLLRHAIAITALAVNTFGSPAMADVTVDTDVADTACSLREAIIAANTNPAGSAPPTPTVAAVPLGHPSFGDGPLGGFALLLREPHAPPRRWRTS